MKKLLIGCAVMTAMLMFSLDSPAKAGNNDWIAPLIGGMVFGVIIGNSARGGHGHVSVQSGTNHYRHGRRQYRRRFRYVEQCLTVPHRYVDNHGNYHDYSRVECRMIRRNPHIH